MRAGHRKPAAGTLAAGVGMGGLQPGERHEHGQAAARVRGVGRVTPGCLVP